MLITFLTFNGIYLTILFVNYLNTFKKIGFYTVYYCQKLLKKIKKCLFKKQKVDVEVKDLSK